MIRVLIAEDSVTVRELLVGILGTDPDIEVIGTAKNGHEAVETAKQLRPDVITMDINMPGMDGFEATKRIMIEAPVPIVIVSGTTDVRDVKISMNALRAGALAVLEKPSGIGSSCFEASVKQLVSTVKAMAGVKVVRHWPSRGVLVEDLASATARDPPPVSPIRVVAMAASTGGPAALARVISDLPAQFPIPILVVQHIGRGFVAGLASWLDTVSPLKVKVAEDGDPLAPSTVYLAADDLHMGVSSRSRIALREGPHIGGFRPSATYLFDAVGKAFGPAAVAVMLTGMGQDGVDGLRTLRSAGARIIAQDEATSVVFGMPGAAIAAGVAEKILPLPDIGKALTHICGEPRPRTSQE